MSPPVARHAPREATDHLEPIRMLMVLTPNVRIGTRELHLTNIHKVLYRKTGFTKGRVIEYYYRIAPFLLPHLKGRPVTMKRYPNGVDKEYFYEKHCPDHRPPWVKTSMVKSASDSQKGVCHCLINDVASLVWIANLADLEIHTLLSKASNNLQPTMVVFDLDPGAPANLLDCCRVALLLRSLLEEMGLESLAKTSGAKGMQVHVPLNTRVTFDQTKQFARTVGEYLAIKDPAHIVAAMSKSLRHGKVFIDWSQNDRHKTTICAYSLRATEVPSVATPVTWREVQSAVRSRDADGLRFSPEEVLRRLQSKGDLFEPLLHVKQHLPVLPQRRRQE